MTTENESFIVWLRQFKGDQSPLGRLWRTVHEDRCLSAKTAEGLRRHIRKHHYYDGVYDRRKGALAEAEKRYDAEMVRVRACEAAQAIAAESDVVTLRTVRARAEGLLALLRVTEQEQTLLVAALADEEARCEKAVREMQEALDKALARIAELESDRATAVDTAAAPANGANADV